MIRQTFLLSFCLLIAACTAPSPSPTPRPPQPPTLTQTTAPPTAEKLIRTATPEPTATELPRSLTICVGAEPDTLYRYGGSMLTMYNVLEAIYDGPIDSNSYGYQPVILVKIPSLADGDAVLQQVRVSFGTPVVDSAGNPTPLASGVVYRPSGCRGDECEETYQGGEVLMDQLVVTFVLLDGLKWSDGHPLTARDSAYSYRLASDQDTLAPKDVIKNTQAYTALSETIVQWIGLPGYLDQNYQINFWHPLPEHVWGDYTAKELLYEEVATRTPLGWGPYIIEEWEYGAHIRLRRNPNYFRADEGLPRFEHLIYRFTGENTSVNLAKLLNGECDLLEQNAPMDDMTAEFLELDRTGELQLITSPGTPWEHADFGIVPAAYDDAYQAETDRPDFFGDVRTRKAIAMCIDREAAAEVAYLGLTELASAYIPASHPLFNAVAPKLLYNPVQGMLFLEEVGWHDHDGNSATPRLAQSIPNVPDGTPFSFTYATTTTPQRQQTAQIIAENLAQCGVQVHLDFVEPGEFLSEGPNGPLFGRAFDMAQFAWLAEVTPPCHLYLSEAIPGLIGETWVNGDNASGYSNPAFDEACRRALSLLPGEPGYEEAHRKAQALWLADLPVIPLYFRLKMSAANADLCGFVLDPTARSDTWNIEAFGYGAQCE